MANVSWQVHQEGILCKSRCWNCWNYHDLFLIYGKDGLVVLPAVKLFLARMILLYTVEHVFPRELSSVFVVCVCLPQLFLVAIIFIFIIINVVCTMLFYFSPVGPQIDLI